MIAVDWSNTRNLYIADSRAVSRLAYGAHHDCRAARNL
jgi:hypothetical protein